MHSHIHVFGYPNTLEVYENAADSYMDRVHGFYMTIVTCDFIHKEGLRGGDAQLTNLVEIVGLALAGDSKRTSL